MLVPVLNRTSLTCMSHSTSWTKGGSTNWSRTFLITRTANGGLYHVSRWLAGSCICLNTKKHFHFVKLRFVISFRRCQIEGSQCTYMTIAEFFMIRPHGPNCWNGDGAFKLRVRLWIEQKKKNTQLFACNWPKMRFCVRSFCLFFFFWNSIFATAIVFLSYITTWEHVALDQLFSYRCRHSVTLHIRRNSCSNSLHDPFEYYCYFYECFERRNGLDLCVSLRKWMSQSRHKWQTFS